MLTMRKEQMNAFHAARGGRFEDLLVEHLRAFTPHQAAALGEPGLCSVIRYGLERANNHGFTLRGPTRFYIETMLILGCDFDTDPQYPWAFAILSDQETPDQVERADRLHASLMSYLGAAATPAMVRRAMVAAQDALEREPPPWGPDFDSALMRTAKALYPEKLALIGEAPVRTLIEDSKRRGDRFEMSGADGVFLLFGLGYAMGHGFAHDPQYPWIADTIENIPPRDRVKRLRARTATYLAQAIRNLDTER